MKMLVARACALSCLLVSAAAGPATPVTLTITKPTATSPGPKVGGVAGYFTTRTR